MIFSGDLCGKVLSGEGGVYAVQPRCGVTPAEAEEDIDRFGRCFAYGRPYVTHEWIDWPVEEGD